MAGADHYQHSTSKGVNVTMDESLALHITRADTMFHVYWLLSCVSLTRRRTTVPCDVHY